MWSRVRHRRLQALSLVALAALLTTSLCLGPLYQRAMEQALAGSVLANATPEQKAIRLSSDDRGPPSSRMSSPPVSTPISLLRSSPSLSRSACRPRRWGVGGDAALRRRRRACTRLNVVAGSCPAESGQVMVSTADVATNGWTVGSQVPSGTTGRGLYPELSSGTVTVVGVYRAVPGRGWLGPRSRAGPVPALQDVGLSTDDWVDRLRDDGRGDRTRRLAPDHLLGGLASTRGRSTTKQWCASDRSSRASNAGTENPGGVRVLIATGHPRSLRECRDRQRAGPDHGRGPGRPAAGPGGVVLWMVLVAATDDRRREIALARLRGRGRRGAAAYLLSELRP